MNWLAALLTVVVLAIAGLHAYWGTGGLWPSASEAELACAVVGDGRTHMPSAAACFTVAGLLGVVAAWPWAILLHPHENVVLAVGIVIAAIFFIRGMAGYSPRWRQRFSREPFATWDIRLYSPLSMLIGAGFMALLARGM